MPNKPSYIKINFQHKTKHNQLSIISLKAITLNPLSCYIDLSSSEFSNMKHFKSLQYHNLPISCTQSPTMAIIARRPLANSEFKARFRASASCMGSAEMPKTMLP